MCVCVCVRVRVRACVCAEGLLAPPTSAPPLSRASAKAYRPSSQARTRAGVGHRLSTSTPAATPPDSSRDLQGHMTVTWHPLPVTCWSHVGGAHVNSSRFLVSMALSSRSGPLVRRLAISLRLSERLRSHASSLSTEHEEALS